MTDRTRQWRDRDTGPPRRTVALLTLLAVTVWGGCSVEKHYEVLSFFFDGVPPPATPEEQALAEGTVSGPGRTPGVSGIVSAHQAYLDRRCALCHGDQANFGFTTSGFSDIGGDACLECHPSVLEDLRVLHGPVAVNACVACHDPHVSAYPKLLTAASPHLCLQCHQAELQGVPPNEYHQDTTRDCLDCHEAHGGDLPFLLKPADTWSAGPQPEP